MRGQLSGVLDEVRLQLELDHERGTTPLSVRARALRSARTAGDRAAERQALIDLAATCIASAATLPAPRRALAESQARSHPPARSSIKPPARRVA